MLLYFFSFSFWRVIISDMFVISMKMTKDDTEKKTRPSAVCLTMAHFPHNEKKTGIINFIFFVSSFFPSKTKLQQFFLSFNAFEEPMLCAKKRILSCDRSNGKCRDQLKHCIVFHCFVQIFAHIPWLYQQR